MGFRSITFRGVITIPGRNRATCVCVCMWGAKFHPTPHHPPSTYIHSAAQRSELLTKGFVARMGDGEVRTYNAKEEKRAWSIDDKHSGRGIS